MKSLERETGIEPATNSLEGCDSTTELLPPASGGRSHLLLRSADTAVRVRNLELMMGLEPMTSPLPRECSTTELHQLLKTRLPLPSYRERSRTSITRKAKKPNSIQVSD